MCRIEDPNDRPFTLSDYFAIAGIAVAIALGIVLFFWPVTSL